MDQYHIKLVLIRKRKKNLSESSTKDDSIYPLRKASVTKESYDYENIRNAIRHWDLYSKSVGNNWNNMMKLCETVSTLGNINQLRECTSIINTEIIPYLSASSMIKKDVYKKMSRSHSDDMKSCYYSMMESLNENIECDRVINNHDLISKRFNIDKLIANNILFEDAIPETLYSLCSLIDTYDIDYRSKFCIAAEMALYTTYNTIGEDIIEEQHLKDKLSSKSILEHVLDYFLINYGRNNTLKFLDEMQECCHKDSFIKNQLDSYIDHYRKLHAQSYIEHVSPIPLSDIAFSYADESIYGLTRDLDQYRSIREETELLARPKKAIDDMSNMIDKAKGFIDTLKMAPSNAINSLKSAIAAVLVPCRVEDLEKGTSNALSYVFYAFITLGMFSVGGALSGIFALIANYIIAKKAQKIHLKQSLQAWTKHKVSVKRKIDSCSDAEKKRRMEAYLSQIDTTIDKIEKAYEEARDKTSNELKKEAYNDEDKASADIDPHGNLTPVSNQYKKEED